MKTSIRCLSLLIATAFLCHSNGAELESLYRDACASTTAPSSVKEGENIVSSLNPTEVNALTADDVKAILKLVNSCLASNQTSVQQLGLTFFLVTQMRTSPLSLSHSTIKHLEEIASNNSSSVQDEALFVLLTMRKIPDDVIQYLRSRLKDKQISPPKATPIVVALLQDQDDSAVIAETLAFADSQSDVSVQIGAIQGLGQLRRPLDQNELAFIQKHLESKSPFVREASIQTAGRLPIATRSMFLRQITDIATDPSEAKEIRSLANSVLRQ